MLNVTEGMFGGSMYSNKIEKIIALVKSSYHKNNTEIITLLLSLDVELEKLGLSKEEIMKKF